MSGRRVLLAGASGLIGRELLSLLLKDESVATVHAVGRRLLPDAGPKLSAQVVDFSNLPQLAPVDEAYVALGTTIKVAGSQVEFRAIDLDAVVALARTAKASGATKIGIVSAMGADPASRVFYNRIKGEMERAVGTVGIPTTVFARPSMLLGDRASLQQPPRAAERVVQSAMTLLRPIIPADLRAIEARHVAASLIDGVRTLPPGAHVLLSGQLQRR